MKVGIELLHQLGNGWSVILYHRSPTLDLYQCPNVRRALIEGCHYESPLYYHPTSPVVIYESSVSLILTEAGMVINEVGII
jgi:hypothetical protein